jgi:para-nitrobenzyl esterase
MHVKHKKTIMKRIILLILTISVLCACKKDNLDDQNTDLPFPLEGTSAQFEQNIDYDTKARTQFDIWWLPESNTPTGLVIYVHGGGFFSGDKDYVYEAQKGGQWDFPSDIRSFLNQGVAFATVRYTLFESSGVEQEGVKKPMNDVKRALQYIRSRAEDFNLDKEKVVLAGNSAGAGTSLWIAFNDDMADLGNSDPVLKEGTRVKGVAVRETQSSYNIEDRWINDVFFDYTITWNDFVNVNESKILQTYGVPSMAEYNTSEIDTYRDDVDMLSLFTADDPAIWVDNTLREVPLQLDLTDDLIINHHAYHARELKERADFLGLENISYYGKDPILFSDQSGETWVDFCIRKLN